MGLAMYMLALMNEPIRRQAVNFLKEFGAV